MTSTSLITLTAPRGRELRRFVVGGWLLVVLVAVGMAWALPSGRDAGAYALAVREARAGASPYVRGVERLLAKHARGGLERTMNYIYPPATLPLVRAAGWVPAWVRDGVFWLLYAAGTWVVLRVGHGFLLAGERGVAVLLTPALVFFPGLLFDDVVVSGNCAPVLYGLMSVAGVVSWRRGQWLWFYGAVLAAGLVKPTMLVWVVAPALLTAGRWRKTVVAGVLGGGLFVVQRWVWPEAFARYTRLMDMEFLYNREFGFSPVGELGKQLVGGSHAYQPVCAAFYGCYAVEVLVVLVRCSRRYLAGRISPERWVPVLLLGVMLLNPRLKQYDAAAVTLPMALVAWRVLSRWTRGRRAAVVLGVVLFGAANLVVGLGEAWDLMATVLMVGLFGVGVWGLREEDAVPVDCKLEEIPLTAMSLGKASAGG